MDFFDRRRRQLGRFRDRELPVLDFPITPANSTAPSRWGRYRQILDDLFVNINDDENGANKQRKRCCREQESVESIIRAGRILDAAGLEDGDHLNLLDWSPSRNLAIVLNDTVHSLNPGSSAHEIVFDYMGSSISSISWAPDGRHLAVGMYDSLIYIWDVERKCPTRTLRNVHWRSSRVGSLAWKCDNILTSGGSDGKVVNSDPRMPSAAHVVQSYRGHGLGDICGLKWSPDCAGFKQLASGGRDGLVHVWDARNQNQWAFRFKVAARDASVRALDWCPFKGCLLATGGGVGGDGKSNGSIRFWNTQTGACMRSVKTGSSAVCALLWSKTNEQFLSSCGGTDQNQMTLWDYPSCVKTGELVGHFARVPYFALSPDGTTVASASGGIDSTLRLWNIFPPVPKPTSRALFSGSYHAHIRLSIPKHKFTMWVACLDRLPTKVRVHHFGVLDENSCTLCGVMVENRDHLFFQCSFSMQIWELVMGFVQEFNPPYRWLDIIDWMIAWKGSESIRRMKRALRAFTTSGELGI